MHDELVARPESLDSATLAEPLRAAEPRAHNRIGWRGTARVLSAGLLLYAGARVGQLFFQRPALAVQILSGCVLAFVVARAGRFYVRMYYREAYNLARAAAAGKAGAPSEYYDWIIKPYVSSAPRNTAGAGDVPS